MLPAPISVLHRTFKLERFRGDQALVINHVRQGGNAFVLMPTGGGKSLCYQIAALCRHGVGVVVSPLIALMQDQVAALKQRGIAAELLNSSLSAAEACQIMGRLRQGKLKLIYMAPETLLKPDTIRALKSAQQQSGISLFAIDEAHCIAAWGHDFRRDYRELARIGPLFPGVPRMALTATADAMTRQEIVEQLGMEDAEHFIASFDRPNLRYRLVPKNNAHRQLEEFIRSRHPEGSGIIYCRTRDSVEQTTAYLQANEWNALPYHAGLDAKVRQESHGRFLGEPGTIIVATIAFGMGIDKPDVRFVAHLDLPESLEAYYQETGRAGRDGLPADALLLFDLQDVSRMRRRISMHDSKQRRALLLHKFEAVHGFCEAASCRRGILLGYFGEDYIGRCENCDSCRTPIASWNATGFARYMLEILGEIRRPAPAAGLVNTLRGIAAEIVMPRLSRVPTFKSGAKLSEQQAWAVVRQLIARRLVELDGASGGLRLADTSKGLPDAQQVLLRL